MSKVIKMFYELKDASSGEILESNIGGQEIAFVSGKNQVLEALESGVINLSVFIMIKYYRINFVL